MEIFKHLKSVLQCYSVITKCHYKNSYAPEFYQLCSNYALYKSTLCSMNSTFPFSYLIKTHDSESRGQEEVAVRDERVSYLHVAPL